MKLYIPIIRELIEEEKNDIIVQCYREKFELKKIEVKINEVK